MTGILNAFRGLGDYDIIPGVIVLFILFLEFNANESGVMHWSSNVSKAIGEYDALSGVIFFH